MKTLSRSQHRSMGPQAAPTFTETPSNPNHRVNEGISDQMMNVLIIIFTLITICISVLSATAQDDMKYRILLRQAMLDMDRMEYDKALVKLLVVRANTVENANVNQMLGVCYLYGQDSTEKAVFYLNQAMRSVSHDYQEWDLDEAHAPVQTAYHLGIAYERSGKFDRAADSYREYLILVGHPKRINTGRTYAVISEKVEKCQLAVEMHAAEMENDKVVFNR